MTHWTCPLCQHKHAARFLKSEEFDLRFELVRCLRCGLISISPRPQLDELRTFYPRDYEPFVRALDRRSGRLWRWLCKRHYAHRCRAVRQACPTGGRILDVGCGTGGFLHEIGREARWSSIGIDLNPLALEGAGTSGIPVLSAEAGQLCFASHFFDVVTMWDVIEHVPNPHATLSEIRRVLKPGGILLLYTPNHTSWQARAWRDYWPGWDVPRHLQIFSEQTIRQILHDAGFEITGPIGHATERYYAVEGLRRALLARTGRPLSSFEKIAASSLGMVAWPLFRWLDRQPAASTIGLAARLIT